MDIDRRRTTGPEARDDRRAERRTQLLDAAVDAIRTVGPGVTMEQLANAGGVTKPILYRHFGDRDGLIRAIAERFSTDLLSTVTTPLATDATARELLRSTVDSYVGFIEREPNLYRFMVQHPPDRREDVGPMGSLVDLIAQRVALVAERAAARRPGATAGPPCPGPTASSGLVHQAGDWWVDDQTMSPRHAGQLPRVAAVGRPRRRSGAVHRRRVGSRHDLHGGTARDHDRSHLRQDPRSRDVLLARGGAHPHQAADGGRLPPVRPLRLQRGRRRPPHRPRSRAPRLLLGQPVRACPSASSGRPT